MGAYSKFFSRWVATLVFLLTLGSPLLFGQRVIYVNGIMNASDDAMVTSNRIRDILNASLNHQGNKRTFVVTNIWNKIGYDGSSPNVWLSWSSFGDNLDALHQDKRELFMLKSAEEKYADDFGQMLGLWGPGRTPVITTGIPPIDQSAAARIAPYADNMFNVPVSITSTENPPPDNICVTLSSMNATQQVVTDIVNDIENNGPAIIVAHSQGNLLANLAYAKLAALYGNSVRQKMVIVNLANTAQFSTDGFNLTHATDDILFDKGVVLNASLEHLPSLHGWYRNTPANVWNPPGIAELNSFQLVSPTFLDSEGEIQLLPTSRHGVIETYLSDSYTVEPTGAMAARVSFTPGARRFRDRFEDLVYAAADSLGPAGLLPIVSMSTPSVSVNSGQSVTLSGAANVSFGTLSSMRWERLDHPEIVFDLPTQANTTLNGSNANSSFTFTVPSNIPTTTLKFGLFATDNRGLTGQGVAEVHVQHVNQPPVITADASYAVVICDTLVINASAEDQDGYIKSAMIQQTNNTNWPLGSINGVYLDSPIPLTVANSGVVNWSIPIKTISNLPGGTYTLQLIVTDNNDAVTIKDIPVVASPHYFVDDFSTVGFIDSAHWPTNTFGASAYFSNGELNLLNSPEKVMAFGTRLFHRGVNFRTYAKLSGSTFIRLTGGRDGMDFATWNSDTGLTSWARSWNYNSATGKKVYQTTYQNINPDVYHLVEFLYGNDGSVTLRVDQNTLCTMAATSEFDYGVRVQFLYGLTEPGTISVVKWFGVTP